MRNRVLLVTLVLYPLLLVSILGLVFADPKQTVPIAVVVSPTGNGPQTLEGETFTIGQITDRIADVTSLTLFTPQTQEGFQRAEEEARKMLLIGDVDAVVIFPDHFLTDITELTVRARVDVLLDRSDLAKSTVAENVVRGAIQRFNDHVVTTKVDIVVDELDRALGGKGDIAGQESFHGLLSTLRELAENPELSDREKRLVEDAIVFVEDVITILESSEEIVQSMALPVDAQVSHVTSGSLFARDIIVPATVALSIFWTGILASSSLTVYERQSHAQVRLNVSPISTGTVMASKLLVTVVIILAQSLFIILAAKLAWDVRVDNPALLVTMIAAGAFAAVGAGLVVAGVSRDTNGSTLLSVLVVFPMMFLSGLFFPVSFMPPVAQTLAHAMPLTYAVDGLRGAMLKRYTFGDAQADLVFLLVFGAIAFVLGLWWNRRRAHAAT
ncbi:MAG: ABC transporter permease [Euryarchaeota archaeon]|nr:ABC transporter permease [Euryarchaeota archaeon]